MAVFLGLVAVFILGMTATAVISSNRIQIREIIMSETQEAVDQVVEQLGKAKGEILGAIATLEEQVAAGQAPDLTALKAAAQALDDVVPDAAPPVEEPVDPPVEEPAPVDPAEPTE